MPIARYQLADGRIARFEMPEGSTPEQGQAFGDQYFANPDNQTSAEPEDKTGFIPALEAGYKRGMGSTNVGIAQVAEAAGLHGVAKGREQAAKEYEQEAAQTFTPTSEEDIKQAATENGPIAQAAMWAKKHLTEPVGGMVGRYGIPTLAGAAAAPFAPEVAGATALARGAAFIASDLPAEMGENTQVAEQAKEAPISLPRNIAGGLVEAAIGAFGLPGTSKLANLMLKQAEPLAAKVVTGELTKEAAIKALGGRGVNIAKEIAANAVTNVGAVTGIEATRRATSGQDITSPEALAGYAENAQGILPLAVPFGGYHGLRNIAKGRELIESAKAPSEVPPIAGEQTTTEAPTPPTEEQPVNEVPPIAGEQPTTEEPTASELRNYVKAVQEGTLDLTDPATQHLQKVMEEHHPGITEGVGGVKVKTPEAVVEEPVKRDESDQAALLKSWGLNPRQKAYKQLMAEDLSTPEGLAKADAIVQKHEDSTHPGNTFNKTFNRNAFEQHAEAVRNKTPVTEEPAHTKPVEDKVSTELLEKPITAKRLKSSPTLQAMVDDHPDLAAKVKNGKLTVGDIYDKLPEANQAAFLSAMLEAPKKERGQPKTIFEDTPAEVAKGVKNETDVGKDETASDKDERYSLSTSDKTTGHTAESLLRAAPPELKALVASGKAVIHNTQETLPERADKQAHPANVKGMTTPDGVTHYVANRLTPSTLHGVALHEVGVHVGMESMVGPKLWEGFKEQIMTSTDPAFVVAREAVPSTTPEAHRAEEALARLVENSPTHSFVRRLISTIRNWARNTFGAKLALTEADARQMAVAALRREAKTSAKTESTKPELYAHADPEVEAALNPANRLTQEMSDKTLAEHIKSAIKAVTLKKDLRLAIRPIAEHIKSAIKPVTPTRIGLLDPHDALGRLLKEDPIYNKVTGELRADQLARQNTQAGSLIRSSVEEGPCGLMGDGTVGVIKKDPHLAIGPINDRLIKWGKKEKLDGPQLMSEVWRAKLGEATLKEDAAMHTFAKTLRTKEADYKAQAKALHKAGAALGKINEAQKLAKDYAKRAEKLEDKLRETLVTPEHIRRADYLLNKYPELSAIIKDFRDVIRADVDLQHQAGLLDADTARDFNAKEWYVPMHRPEEPDAMENGGSHWGAGTGAKTAKHLLDYTRKGGKQIINVVENIRRQHAFMISSAMQNLTRNIAANSLARFGEASLAKDQGKTSSEGNLAAYVDGKKVWYVIKDPDALIAFQNFNHGMGPLLRIMGLATSITRHTALINPVYWYRQIVRDPIMASFVANVGVITPFHSLYEFGHILAGHSPGAELLRRRGMIGPVDLIQDYNSLHQQLGRAVKQPPGIWATIPRIIMRIHEASDSATRVAVFKSALKIAKKEGLSGQAAENFAAHRARESINFSVHGTSQTLHTIRHAIPFFSSNLNGLDTVYRAAVGHNLNPKEKAEIKKKFISRAVMMTSMSAMYALMMQDDKSYKQTDFNTAGNNWLIAGDDDEHGLHSFYKVPAPYEVGFLFKTLPELAVRSMAGNATQKEIFKAIKNGLAANTPPMNPIPQLLKPSLETAANISMRGLPSEWRPIESAHEMTLPAFARGAGDSKVYDYASKQLDKAGIKLSPKKLKNFMVGTFAEFAAMGAAVADAAFTQADERTPVKSIYKTVLLRGVMTDPTESKAMSQLYEMTNSAQEIVNLMNDYQSSANVKGIKDLVAKPETKKALQQAELLSGFHGTVSELRAQIRTLANQPDTPTNRARIAKLRYQANIIAGKGVQTVQKKMP